MEERLAPAVVGDLSVVGSTLVYTGTTGQNAITVSGSDSDLTISDAAGTILSSVPGLSAGGLNTLTGAVPSYIRSIAINGNNGTGTITVNGLNSTRALILSGATITNAGPITAASLTENGAVIDLGGTVQTGAGPFGGAVTFNGAVNLTGATTIETQGTAGLDGAVTFSGPVAGTSALSVQAGDIAALGAINLASGSSGLALVGNNVSLHAVTEQVQVSIEAQAAVTLNGDLTAGGTVSILANEGASAVAGFTQVQGNIVTTAAGVNNAVEIEVNLNGGTGNATVRGITTGTDSTVLIDTLPTSGSGGGAIVDGNTAGVLNVDVPYGTTGGTLTLMAGATGINLDTSVANLTATLPTTGSVLSTAIRNTGQALDVRSATTGGDLSISNNQALSVNNVSAGGNVTLATTGTPSAIALSQVESTGTNSTLTISASGSILGAPASSTTEVGAANVVATAATGIGTAADPFYVSSPNATVTFSGSTNSGGMFINYGVNDFQVNRATASSGDVSITPDGGLALTVAGNVSTALGGAITLDANDNAPLVFTGGTVSSDTGDVTLAAGSQITLPAAATISTGGNIVIGEDAANFIQPYNAVLDLSGTVAAGGDLTVDGGTHTTLMSVSGVLAAGGTLTLDSSHSSSSSTLLLGGTLSATGNLSVLTGGTTSLLTSGTIQSGGATALGTAGLGATLSMQLGGAIQSAGPVTINGASGGYGAVLTLIGTIVSGAVVDIASHGTTAGDTFQLTTGGAITGTSVTVTGSTGGANTFDLGGKVTATGGNITVTAAGDAANSAFDITGSFAATGTTDLVGGSGADSFVVVPSTASTFTFSGAGTYSLQIDTPLANLVNASATFASPITFTAASGLQSWTKTSGTWHVTATAP